MSIAIMTTHFSLTAVLCQSSYSNTYPRLGKFASGFHSNVNSPSTSTWSSNSHLDFSFTPALKLLGGRPRHEILCNLEKRVSACKRCSGTLRKFLEPPMPWMNSNSSAELVQVVFIKHEASALFQV